MSFLWLLVYKNSTCYCYKPLQKKTQNVSFLWLSVYQNSHCAIATCFGKKNLVHVVFIKIKSFIVVSIRTTKLLLLYALAKLAYLLLASNTDWLLLGNTAQGCHFYMDGIFNLAALSEQTTTQLWKNCSSQKLKTGQWHCILFIFPKSLRQASDHSANKLCVWKEVAQLFACIVCFVGWLEDICRYFGNLIGFQCSFYSCQSIRTAIIATAISLSMCINLGMCCFHQIKMDVLLLFV